MRDPRDDFELDEQILELGGKGPLAVVEHLRGLLERDVLPPDTSEAEVLVQVGAYLDLAGDHVAAEPAFRAAVANGGPSHPDARCYLAQWCLDHGDPAEGERLLAEVWATRPNDPDVYLYVGELFEERDDLSLAIRWFTTGALRSMRDEDQSVRQTQLLLASRRRARLAQGFTEDDYDMLATELRDELYGTRDDVDG